MVGKKGWTIGKTRSLLYRSGKILGDVNAIKRGKIGQRVTNRLIGNPAAEYLANYLKTSQIYSKKIRDNGWCLESILSSIKS